MYVHANEDGRANNGHAIVATTVLRVGRRYRVGRLYLRLYVLLVQPRRAGRVLYHKGLQIQSIGVRAQVVFVVVVYIVSVYHSRQRVNGRLRALASVILGKEVYHVQVVNHGYRGASYRKVRSVLEEHLRGGISNGVNQGYPTITRRLARFVRLHLVQGFSGRRRVYYFLRTRFIQSGKFSRYFCVVSTVPWLAIA